MSDSSDIEITGERDQDGVWTDANPLFIGPLVADPPLPHEAIIADEIQFAKHRKLFLARNLRITDNPQPFVQHTSFVNGAVRNNELYYAKPNKKTGKRSRGNKDQSLYDPDNPESLPYAPNYPENPDPLPYAPYNPEPSSEEEEEDDAPFYYQEAQDPYQDEPYPYPAIDPYEEQEQQQADEEIEIDYSNPIVVQCAHPDCNKDISIGLPYCERHTKEKYKVVVRESKIPNGGLGLFAWHPRGYAPVFAAGEWICPYHGEIKTNEEMEEKYPGKTVARYGIEIGDTGIFEDAAVRRGIGSLANHASGKFRGVGRAVNAEFIPRRMGGGEPRVWLRAKDTIWSKEEIYANYGPKYGLD